MATKKISELTAAAALGGTEEIPAVQSGATVKATAAQVKTFTSDSPQLTTPEINDTSGNHQYVFGVNELAADRTITLPLLTGNDTFVFEGFTQTLTNKTLTSPTLTSPTVGTSLILDQTTENYTVTWADPAAARALTIADPGGNDTFAYLAATQTLTNKTLTAPAFSGAFSGTYDLVEPAYADVASATTTNIGAESARWVRITGTTTITAFDTVAAGIVRHVRFAAALTLTHNGTSLILPGAANITTAADDTATFVSLGSGNWLCTNYKKADGTAVVSSTVSAASVAEMEAGSATDVYTSPGRQHRHPSAAKAWADASISGSLNAGYNISGITDTATGQVTVGWDTDFSSSNYAAVAIGRTSSNEYVAISTQNAGAIVIDCRNSGTGNLADPDAYGAAAFGDH